MRPALLAGWILALLVAVFAVVEAFRPNVPDPVEVARESDVARLTREAAFWRTESAALVRDVEQAERVRDSLFTVLAETERDVSNQRPVLQAEAARAGEAFAATLDSIRVSAPHVIPLVDAAEAQAGQQVAAVRAELAQVERVAPALRVALDDSEARHRLRDRVEASLRNEIVVLEETARVQAERVAYWQGQATPGFLTRLWRARGEMAGAFGLGIVIGLVVR